MAWLMHGVVWSEHLRPKGALEHERVTHGPLTVLLTNAAGVVMPTQLDPTQLDDEVVAALQRHDALLGAYAVEQDVLPLRFGLSLEEAAHARDVLSRSEPTLTEALQRLSGKKEYSIRLVALETDRRTDASASDVIAADYLQARLAKRRAAEIARRQTAEFVARIHDLLTESAILRPLASLGGSRKRVAGWSCLRRPRDFENISVRLQAVADDAAVLGIEIDMAGPHAPFAFAELPELEREMQT